MLLTRANHNPDKSLPSVSAGPLSTVVLLRAAACVRGSEAATSSSAPSSSAVTAAITAAVTAAVSPIPTAVTPTCRNYLAPQVIVRTSVHTTGLEDILERFQALPLVVLVRVRIHKRISIVVVAQVAEGTRTQGPETALPSVGSKAVHPAVTVEGEAHLKSGEGHSESGVECVAYGKLVC